MSPLNWLRQRKLAKLAEELHVVSARLANEHWMASRAGKIYPTIVSDLVADKARLEHRIGVLKEKQK